MLIILAIILAFIYVASPFLTAGLGLAVIPVAFAVTWFRWVIAGIFGLLGIYLISKKKYRTLGIILVILAVLFGWLYSFLYSIISVSFADLFGLRLIVTLIFIILGFYFMLKTNNQGKHVNFGLGLFLVILGIAFWVMVPFFSSALFEKYGLKGEIVAEEANIAARLQRFWFYVKYPEKYFAEFGRFDNPQAQEKKAKVGLEIKKFEPIVGLFRSDQKIRLTAEIIHHALPKFDIINEEEQEVNTVSIKFGCEADVDNKKINGTISIVREGLADKEVVQDLLEGVQKNQNRSYFVFCDFDKGKIRNPQGKNESTIRVKLKTSYANFVTESILKNYIIGEKKYRDLVYENNNIRQNYELELLNALRSAASYPGLVNNERKTISEYSSGPIKLSLTILNPQPLVINNDVYTLILRSEPNSIDWEGKIEPKNIFLDAPNWFKIDD